VKTTGWLRSALGLGALLLGWTAASAAPAPFDPGALKEIPANAPLVVHLRGLEGMADRFFSLARQVVGDKAAKGEAFVKTVFEKGVDGRKLRGLAKDGPVFVVFTDMPQLNQDPPRMALIAAVTNYKAFRDGVLKDEEQKTLKQGEGYETAKLKTGMIAHFIDRKNFVVVTPSEDVARTLAKRGVGLDEKIGKALGAKLLSSDLGVYVNMDMMTKTYAEQIKKGKEMAEQGLKKAIEDADKGEKTPVKTQLEIARMAVGPIFQAVEDSQGLLLSFEFRPAGLAYHLENEFRPTSATANILKDSRTASFKEMAGLPDGHMVYTGIQYSPLMFQMMAGVLYGALGNAEGAEAKVLKTALDALRKANPGPMVGCANLESVGLQVWDYPDPKEGLAAHVKLVESMTTGSTIFNATLKNKPVVKPAAQKYEGIEFTEVKLVWDLEKMASPPGAVLTENAKKVRVEAFRKLIGESTAIWYGADGKHVYQVSGKEWAEAKKLLVASRVKLVEAGGDGNFKEVRKELPDEMTMVMMIDLVHYAASLLEAVRPLLQENLEVPKNWPGPAPRGKSSFAGLGVTLQGERAAVDLYLSAEAMKAGYETFIAPLANPAPR
jgi:hypothetical protein